MAIIGPDRRGSAGALRRRAAGAVACLAIVLPAAGGTGCGEDEVDQAINEAQEQGRKATEGAQKAAEEAKKGLPEDAQQKIDEAEKKAKEAIDEAEDQTGAAVEKAKKEAEEFGY